MIHPSRLTHTLAAAAILAGCASQAALDNQQLAQGRATRVAIDCQAGVAAACAALPEVQRDLAVAVAATEESRQVNARTVLVLLLLPVVVLLAIGPGGPPPGRW